MILDYKGIFRGIFVRYGNNNYWKDSSNAIHLKDILDVNLNIIVAERLFITNVKTFSKLEALEIGHIIEFNARIETGSQFSRITRARKINQLPLKLMG